jgi:hypothetical protein
MCRRRTPKNVLLDNSHIGSFREGAFFGDTKLMDRGEMLYGQKGFRHGARLTK